MRKSDKPVVILGITGGIGSGKSTVAQKLSSMGAVLIDADKIAGYGTVESAESTFR